MALTLAQRNQLRKRAAKEAAATAPAASMAGANSYELQLAQLLQDRLRIKNVHSNEGKAELKRQLLPAYEPYIQGVLAAGQGAQDEVLTTVMVWRLDADDYAGALEIAAYVIQHNLGMPDRFARTSPCLVAEEIAEAALKALKAGGEFPLDVLERAHQLTAEQDMPDEARAKLHLAIGKAFGLLVDEKQPQEQDPIHLQAAQVHLARAIELHDKCGAKKDLDRVQRLLKKHAEPATPPAS